jgi:hypothetical protein
MSEHEYSNLGKIWCNFSANSREFPSNVCIHLMWLHCSFHSCLFRPSSVIMILVLWQLNNLCSYYSVITHITYVSVRFIRLEYLTNYVINITALHWMLRVALLLITELQVQYLNQNVNHHHHQVVCPTRGPQNLQNRVIHTVRSSTSPFNFQYPFVFVESSSSCLPLLARLPVTSDFSIFPSKRYFRRQFLR